MNSQIIKSELESQSVIAKITEGTKQRLAASAQQLKAKFQHRLEQNRVRVWTGEKIALVLMVLWIGFVSMYDLYWSFKTQMVLAETEQNPIGTWLITLDNGDIALFMTAKTIGTMFVLLTIPTLYWFRRKWGLTVATAIASFQALLMIYLNFGHILLPQNWV